MKQSMVTRAYNSIEIKNGLVYKRSTDKKLLNESTYYLKIPEELGLLFARYHGGQTIMDSFENPTFELILKEYKNYKNSYESIQQSINLYYNTGGLRNSIRVLMKELHNHSIQKGCVNDNLAMIKTKTEQEHKKLLTNKIFEELNIFTNLQVNGQNYLNFSEIWNFNIIQDAILRICANDVWVPIHGDFCLSNILVSEDKNHLVLIDPRGSWGSKITNYGLAIYDRAKLYHSTVGQYEDIIYDNFSVEYKKDIINYNFNNSVSLENILNIPDDELLVMGTIFIGMCARHYDSLDRQIVMYCQGVKFLNEFLRRKI